jgi:aminoglycoside phosphotransferase (APT) family kinase protein
MRDYLKRSSVDSVHLVHRDIRTGNFIVSNGNLMLIDFENGGVGEYVEDFSYLTTIIPPEHYSFSENVLKNYLRNINQECFWNKNLFYSTLKVAEYAVWKYKRTGRQMKYQAENLIKQYNCFNSVYPEWLIK